MAGRPPTIITPPEAWEALEQLPRAIRDVLAIAPDPYEPESVLDQWRKAEAGGWTVADYVQWFRKSVIPPGYRP